MSDNGGGKGVKITVVILAVAVLFGGPLVLSLFVTLIAAKKIQNDQAADPCNTGTNVSNISNVKGSNNVDTAMKTLIAAGLKPHQAAGLVGNWQQEATPALDPTITNGTHNGIAQWDRKNRWSQLERYAEAKGMNPRTLETQVRFAMWELGYINDWPAGGTGAYGRVGAQLKAATSSDQAAELIYAKYEIPGDGSVPPRQAFARTLAARYADAKPGAAEPAAFTPTLTPARPAIFAQNVAEKPLKERIAAAAAWARANGWLVIEFAQEGTNHPGAHMPGSDHNSGLAFDANWPGESGNNTPGEVKNWPAFRDYLKSVNLGAIYGNEANHLNHVHVMPPGRPNDAVGATGVSKVVQEASTKPVNCRVGTAAFGTDGSNLPGKWTKETTYKGHINYQQTDPAWGKQKTSHGVTIGAVGCGPFAMANIIQNFGYDVDPAKLTLAASKAGITTSGGSNGVKVVEHFAPQFKLKHKVLPEGDKAAIVNALQKGGQVMIGGYGAPPFLTSTGHIISLWKYNSADDTFLVSDSGRRKNNLKPWPADTVLASTDHFGSGRNTQRAIAVYKEA